MTYQGERLEENVRELSEGLKDPLLVPCDVAKDEDLDQLAAAVQKEFGRLDFVIHSVALGHFVGFVTSWLWSIRS